MQARIPPTPESSGPSAAINRIKKVTCGDGDMPHNPPAFARRRQPPQTTENNRYRITARSLSDQTATSFICDSLEVACLAIDATRLSTSTSISALIAPIPNFQSTHCQPASKPQPRPPCPRQARNSSSQSRRRRPADPLLRTPRPCRCGPYRAYTHITRRAPPMRHRPARRP